MGYGEVIKIIVEIFRYSQDAVEVIETIENVSSVLNHSAGVTREGTDIEIIMSTPPYEFDRREIHLESNDFFVARA